VLGLQLFAITTGSCNGICPHEIVTLLFCLSGVDFIECTGALTEHQQVQIFIFSAEFMVEE
jgi:hypothetical protein